jgi:Tfp pilus assembly protein PilX
MENNTMDKNKNMWIWVVVALIVIGIIVFFAMNKKDDDARLSTNDQTAMDAADRSDPDGEEDVSEGSISASNGSASPQVTLSYQQALVKYKDARIQLDKTCQASPDKMTFKDGTTIMIDNRAPVARTVKVGSTFSIKAYGFKLVKLTSGTVPTTWYVDCDGSQNVSTILIQD